MDYPKKINDDRLTGYIKRVRSGPTQIFYIGDDERDFERYRAEGGGVTPDVKMHDKLDTIRVSPPERHVYAELIDGEWWWVNGCAECNGEPRGWMTYIECDVHNVCANCKTPRAELSEPPWGRVGGWVCKPCADKEHKLERALALAAMPDEYDKWEYYNIPDLKCPYCDYVLEEHEHHEADNEKVECPRCDHEFIVSAEHSVSYTMEKKDG